MKMAQEGETLLPSSSFMRIMAWFKAKKYGRCCIEVTKGTQCLCSSLSIIQIVHLLDCYSLLNNLKMELSNGSHPAEAPKSKFELLFEGT